MNVLLIGSFDLYLLPYSDKYIAHLKRNNIDFKFIYRNRSCETTKKEDFYIPFNCGMNSYKSIFFKIYNYIRFKKFVKYYLKDNHFDKVVVLATQTMFLFRNYLIKNFKNNYIFDYRDETYEKHFLYKKCIEKCIIKSYKTVFSSPGFKENFKNISDQKFVICHNNKLNVYAPVYFKKDFNIIRLCYWGAVRNIEYFKKIIQLFGNDNRFEMNIHGKGYDKQLFKYCKEYNNFTNVHIFGQFSQEEIHGFACENDYLLNCYSNNGIQKNALTVKMYEGINFNIPMIIQKDSYMDKYLSENDYFHPSFDFDNYNCEEGEAFKNQLSNFDIDEIHDVLKDNSRILNAIEKDEAVFSKLLIEFFVENKL